MAISPTPVSVDRLKRPLRDLRISVIDNCNFRCTYCMPSHEKYRFLKREQWLTIAEIAALGQIFMEAGVEKFRLTGGEPLLRPDIAELIASLSALQIKDLSLTTNGYLLKPMLRDLYSAGLKRLTVSMDSVQESTFATMSGGQYKVSRVMDALAEARNIGFSSIKVNCVVQRGVNDHEIEDMITYCAGLGLIPRFIEFMDVGNKNHWEAKEVVPSRELVQRLSKKHKIEPLDENYFGEVASRYLLDDSVEIGFISSVSQPFCGSCTRARLSTDGKVYTCLFSGKGVDLMPAIRPGLDTEKLREQIHSIWAKREDRYSEERAKGGPKHDTKVEMYQIGG